jgi:exodeoxyribonuclease VII small subunit
MKNFETEYKELQTIVEKLEKGEVYLDASIDQFKKGMELLTSLRSQLKKVENELKELDVKLTEDSEQ